MKNFSVFEYFYRDASNYKSWRFLLLQGSATPADTEDLQRHLDSNSYFIAEQLRIPPLYEELWAFSSGPTADDHVWHSFSALRPATVQEMKAPVFDTLKNFLQRVKAVEVWDETLSPHWGI